MDNYQILLFDADDTLFDFSACEEKAFQLAFRQFGYPVNRKIYKLYEGINKGLWKQYEQGRIDKNTLIYSRFALLFQEIGIQDDGILFEDVYQELLGQQHFFIDGAQEVVQELYKSHDLYIVTNGITQTQLRRFRDSQIDRFMKKIFVSEETGYQKPRKEYFDYCFERIEGFDQKRTLIIGDSLSSDIRGGNNAGIATCWYNPGRHMNETDSRIDYEINDLRELLTIME